MKRTAERERASSTPRCQNHDRHQSRSRYSSREMPVANQFVCLFATQIGAVVGYQRSRRHSPCELRRQNRLLKRVVPAVEANMRPLTKTG